MSLTVRAYSENDHQAWSRFVENHPGGTIAHNIGWRGVMRDGLGHHPLYLVAENNGAIAGVLPLFLIKTWWRTRLLVSIPWLDYGGALAESVETAQALIDQATRIAQNESAEFIEFRSIDRQTESLPTREGKVTFKLNLESDHELLWKSFNAKLRNQIRKADKSGLTTQFGGAEMLPEFYKVFSWKMHQLGTPVWGLRFFELMFEQMPDTVQMIVVRLEGSTIAAGLILKGNGELYVPSAASYSQYLKLCPNHALYWNVIKQGCDTGYKAFDFGRSTIDSNTYKFKKQWVPDPTVLDWQYVLNKADDIPSVNPDNPKYKTVISLWQKMPLFMANWLGPKVIRNFP